MKLILNNIERKSILKAVARSTAAVKMKNAHMSTMKH